MTNRRLILCLAISLAVLTQPRAGAAQINLGIHGARAAQVFGGANGVGASLEIDFPLVPIDLFIAGDYFFPDCGTVDGCSFSGGSADVHFGLPLPVVQPFASVGLVARRFNPGDGAGAVTDRGIGVGVGLNLGTLVLGAYAEARYEFVDPDDQIVVRVGIRF